MLREYLAGKIHRAVVTEANPDYNGSIVIDRDLMDLAGLAVHQKVLVANCANGHRFETYVIEGARGCGDIALNGAAALLGRPGDRVIIMAFGLLTAQEAVDHQPLVVHVTDENRPVPDGAAAPARP
jgi:aspartate 1-decarboxylase